MISQKELQELFDYKDGNLYWKINLRNGIQIGKKAGCLHHTGYIIININGKKHLAHRLIYSYFNGEIPDELQIDHINHDPSDNSYENLRLATNRQNCQNGILRKNNTSGVKGISWHKQHEKWQVRCYLNEKRKHLGYFDNKEEAEEKVKTFREENHKEFTCHG